MHAHYAHGRQRRCYINVFRAGKFGEKSFQPLNISKYIYIAQDREKLQMHWVTVTNRTGTSYVCSERRQCDVWCMKFGALTKGRGSPCDLDILGYQQ